MELTAVGEEDFAVKPIAFTVLKVRAPALLVAIVSTVVEGVEMNVAAVALELVFVTAAVDSTTSIVVVVVVVVELIGIAKGMSRGGSRIS